jgi:hypothetical protein
MYNVDVPSCDHKGKVFVGQRAEPFFVALGETFDLVNYQGGKLPIVDLEGGGGVSNSKSNNDILNNNVDVLALELHKSCLKGKGTPVIGVWTRTRSKSTGRQNQRMANPLVNELIIGLEDKDKWNKLTPKDDKVFAEYFDYPTFPELLNILFSPSLDGSPRIAPNNFPRRDLNWVLQRGLPGLNFLYKDGYLADMVRLNLSIPATPQGQQSQLGVLGGDLAGFPNGRRPGDDVVDIVLRVAQGVLCHTPFAKGLKCNAEDAPFGTLAYGDGADGDSTDYPNSWPYVNVPFPGARTF